jgi:hypothetical protein
MVDSERIEVPCMGAADAERGHGDQSHYRDGRNFKQFVHRGSPAFILRISLAEFYGCSDEPQNRAGANFYRVKRVTDERETDRGVVDAGSRFILNAVFIGSPPPESACGG